MSTSAIIVDDTDGTKLFYFDHAWTAASTSNEGIYNNTVTLATAPGRAQITFVGSQVQVVGVVRARASGNSVHPITSTYTIDDEVVGSFTAAPGDTERDGVAFFSSKTLELGYHVLVVNVTSASADYPFVLDYVMFVPAPTLSSTFSLSAVSSSSSGLTAGISFTAVSTTTESVLSSSEASGTTIPITTASGSTGSKHTGAIIGGVIGGVALLAVLVLFWWYRRRRELGGKNEAVEKDGDHVGTTPQRPTTPGITPFLLPRDYSGPSANVVPPETAAPLAPRSVLGTPDTTPLVSSSGKAALIAAMNDRNGSGSALASGSGGRSTPSEVSFASGSRSTSQLLASPGPGESEQSAGSSIPPGRRRRDKGQPSVPPQPPGDHGAVFDDTLSQAPTEFPPAYTPS